MNLSRAFHGATQFSPSSRIPIEGSFSAAKTLLRRVAWSLALAGLCVHELPAQKVELAKISLGMSEQDAKAALGPGYQFFHQADGGFPNLLYVFAGNPAERTGYSLALVDGKVQAFQFSKGFPEGDYPLMVNLRNSVASKLWQPQQPNGSIWLSDSAGHALLADPRLNCGSALPFGDTQFLRTPQNMSPAMVDVLKGLTQPRLVSVDPKCGVYVQIYSTGFYANAALAMHTGLVVENIAAFSKMATDRLQRDQDRKNSQTRHANQVKCPY